MTDWRYIRWLALRNTPLFFAVSVPLLGLGFWASSYVPQSYESRSTMMLEQAPGSTQSTRPRPGEAAPERLRVIAQKVISPTRIDSGKIVPQFNPDDLKLTVIAGRERATLLNIEARALDPDRALVLNTAVIDAVRSEYEKNLRLRLSGGQDTVRARVEDARDLVTDLTARLELSRGIVALIPANEASRITERLRKIEKLETLQSDKPGQPENPARRKLETELAQALTIYSDAHPKVILLQQELDAQRSPLGLRSPAIDLEALVTERLQLELRLNQVNAARQDLAALRAEHADALRALSAAHRDENRLSRRASAGFAQEVRMLSVVAPPERPSHAAMPSPLLAQIFSLVFALLTSVAICWVRYRRDKRIYRAQDLERHLGITPFATLPRHTPVPV